MRYQPEHAPELTWLLLSAFTEVPQPAIERGLERYLWRHARFGYAARLADILDEVRSGLAGHFLYHQQSGLLFAHVHYGYHQLFLAHLCALQKTDFSCQYVTWNVQQFHGPNPIRQLADDFVCEGHGLFVSTMTDGRRVTVGATFQWGPLERIAFDRFERDTI
ncbi:hypothetical protein [Paraburkholderia sediminicola]|uniref:hypothetical protein n=1 Tax=Paraburkholderia sediminicola TaxID=458836 RepID=UPI0038B71CF6